MTQRIDSVVQEGVGEGELGWTVLGHGGQPEECGLSFPVLHQGGASSPEQVWRMP